MESPKESPAITAARLALAAAKAKAEEAQIALTAEQESEEAQIARLQLQQQAAERERLRLEREKASEHIYRKACLEHGEHRVARIHTVEGPLVLRPMTGLEADDLDVRQDALAKDIEKTKAAIEAACDTLLYPTAEEFREWLAKYPTLSVDVFKARNKVMSGLKEEERGKG